jgi:hypothetical protein
MKSPFKSILLSNYIHGGICRFKGPLLLAGTHRVVGLPQCLGLVQVRQQLVDFGKRARKEPEEMFADPIRPRQWAKVAANPTGLKLRHPQISTP